MSPEGYSLLEVSHFMPLRYGGPDEDENVGMKTPNVHRIYEGLVTILPTREILFAPDLPPAMPKQFNGRTFASFPNDQQFWPKAEYLDFHRQNVFEARL